MADTEIKKGILRSARDVCQKLLHVILIFPLAGLKALDAGIQHLITELTKV